MTDKPMTPEELAWQLSNNQSTSYRVNLITQYTAAIRQAAIQDERDLKNALNWYADANNYYPSESGKTISGSYASQIDFDKGEKARLTLKNLKSLPAEKGDNPNEK